MSTFVELQKSVQDLIGDTSSTTLAVLKDEINNAIQTFLMKGLWRFSLRQTTLSTSSGVQTYYFPADFEKTISLTQRDDDIQMKKIWVSDFERLVPDPSGYTGRPKYYMELLNERVFAQPTVASVLTLVSDSNSDLTASTGAKASIYGVAGGVDRYELVSLSAQNFVSSILSFTKVYDISLNLSCFGTIAAYQKTVGTSISKLYPGELERSYKQFQVFPIPDATYTLYLTYQAGQIKLINDSDICMIPSKYLPIVRDMVAERFMMRQGDEKVTYYSQKVEVGLNDARKDEDMEWDYTPSIESPVGYYYDQNNPFVRAYS